MTSKRLIKAILAISRFPFLPKDMICGDTPDDFEPESRSKFDSESDFMLVFESRQSAINVANWILNAYDEEFYK